MSSPIDSLRPGQQVSIRLANGALCRGQIDAHENGWLRLRTMHGSALVQLVHVAVISIGDDVSDDALPKPSSKDTPFKTSSRAPGRPWPDEELRRLADGFLEAATDADLAQRFHRTRGAIKELHQAFEAARGNLVEDQISQVAQTWVARWRRVLTT